jgi:glutathionyl-hydroquinone reductase
LTLEKYLLKEVDQYEQDFKEMFAYLNEVEEMLHGDDVDTIKEMIDISDVRMKGHITQYDQLNKRMVNLADEAVESMKALGKYGDLRTKEIADRAVQ